MELEGDAEQMAHPIPPPLQPTRKVNKINAASAYAWRGMI
jgi:hypothetical protein